MTCSELEHPARDHQVHLIADSGHLLVHGAKKIPKHPAGAVFWNHTETHLVGHQNHLPRDGQRVADRGETGGHDGVQLRRRCLPQLPGVQDGGKPGPQAIDEHRALGTAEDVVDGNRFDGPPRRGTTIPVQRHPGIPIRVGTVSGSSGSDVGDAGGTLEQRLGMARLAGANASGDQDPHPFIVGGASR